jgi:hypothetical protein
MFQTRETQEFNHCFPGYPFMPQIFSAPVGEDPTQEEFTGPITTVTQYYTSDQEKIYLRNTFYQKHFYRITALYKIA